MRRGFIAWAALTVAACGGSQVADAQREARAPENVRRKTAAILAPDAPESVTVSNIRMAGGDRSLMVEWDARTPAGDFACNADRMLDIPMCEPQAE
jgi:hypothetical protein